MPDIPKPLWKWTLSPDQWLVSAANSMSGHLGIRLTEVGPDYLVGTMPVDHRTRQPYGRLHGGANVTLAEELGSFAANMCLDAAREFAVGLDINANHLRGVKSGTVTGTARSLHLGRTTQVWEIRIEDEAQRLVCISRITLAVVPRQLVAPAAA